MPGAHQFVQIDLAAGLLYAFFAFFFILVLWLHREGKREGYPLISDRPSHPLRVPIQGFPGVPPLKVFKLKHVDPHLLTRQERDLTGLVVPADSFGGSPLVPTGDAMRDGVGPAAYAERSDVPDLTFDDESPKIVPLRAAPGYSIGETDPDPRGKPVITLDGRVAGIAVDLWVDKSELILRYIEVEVAGSARRVLVPMFLSTINSAGTVRVVSVTAPQLAAAPAIARPEQITLLEEDKVAAYFGGGHFYATPERNEALV
jgi:photosynthetic reaction center H subunit